MTIVNLAICSQGKSNGKQAILYKMKSSKSQTKQEVVVDKPKYIAPSPQITVVGRIMQ